LSEDTYVCGSVRISTKHSLASETMKASVLLLLVLVPQVMARLNQMQTVSNILNTDAAAEKPEAPPLEKVKQMASAGANATAKAANAGLKATTEAAGKAWGFASEAAYQKQLEVCADLIVRAQAEQPEEDAAGTDAIPKTPETKFNDAQKKKEDALEDPASTLMEKAQTALDARNAWLAWKVAQKAAVEAQLAARATAALSWAKQTTAGQAVHKKSGEVADSVQSKAEEVKETAAGKAAVKAAGVINAKGGEMAQAVGEFVVDMADKGGQALLRQCVAMLREAGEHVKANGSLAGLAAPEAKP